MTSVARSILPHLVDVYFSSVGRGCVLNLGIAPNNEGLVGADDVRRLREFGDYIKKFNAVDLAEDATVWRFPGIYQACKVMYPKVHIAICL